jgi:pimeloyl-ACP methyl ester carboxylesterase
MVTGDMFEPVIEHLAARHRVIVPDLRGHGRSRRLPPPYTAAQLASDLSHLLDNLGIDSTAVLDYSQGGAIAQQLVLDYPKRCDHLVLACTYAFNMATFREKLEGHLFSASRQGPRYEAVREVRRFTGLEAARQGTCRLGRQARWRHGGPGPQVDVVCLEGDNGVRQ